MDEYLGVLRRFCKYYDDKPIKKIGEHEIRKYLLYLIEQNKSSRTIKIHKSALQFIYGTVLERNVNTRMIPRQRDYREFHDLMSKIEIMQFFSVIDNLRDRAMFETIIVKLRKLTANKCVSIVHKGKGDKDRYTLLSQRNLELLRRHKLSYVQSKVFSAIKKCRAWRV